MTERIDNIHAEDLREAVYADQDGRDFSAGERVHGQEVDREEGELPCAVVRDLLPLYHDGVVSEETAGIIEAHLEGCEDCRAELNSIRSDELIEGNIIEQDRGSAFSEFRESVRSIRRNGTVRGLLIAAVAVAVFIGGLIFLNNAPVFKRDADVLGISDVYKFDYGDELGEGIYFTVERGWSGIWSMQLEDSSDPSRVDISFRTAAIGSRATPRDADESSLMYILFDDEDDARIDWSKVTEVTVNGKPIWTAEDGDVSSGNAAGPVTEAPEYIKEIRRAEVELTGEQSLETDITESSVSLIYPDRHGIRWDRSGMKTAEFKVDEDGNIISVIEIITDAEDPVPIVIESE